MVRVTTPSGLSLRAEEFPGEGPPILLVMGLGAQMLLWHEDFCQQLVDLGHRVIRFDNRDVGESSRVDAPAPNVPLSYLRARFKFRITPAYTLADMADDTISVLDHFGIESAGIVGASMGGMIAQHVASKYPERAASLVSIMSAARSPRPRSRAIRALLRRPSPGREGYQAHSLHFFRTIGSQTHPINKDRIYETSGRCFDRGPSPEGFARQFSAILADGDRTEMLRGLTVPALVIHGDEDPLIPLQHGIWSAKLMRAHLEVIQGMGHDLPTPCWPAITQRISEHVNAYSGE